MAKTLKMLGQRRTEDPEPVLSLRTEIRGGMVFAEENGMDGEAVNLVMAHPSGQEFVLPMDATQNVELARLLLRGKPVSTLQVLAEAMDIEIAHNLPSAA